MQIKTIRSFIKVTGEDVKDANTGDKCLILLLSIISTKFLKDNLMITLKC